MQKKSNSTVVNTFINDSLLLKPSKSTTDSISYSGILLLYTDSMQMDNQILNIYNQDNSVFTTIKSKDHNEPSSNMLEGNILAYYPDYYIVHFNADKISDKEYRVKVGSSTKIIKSNRYVEYLSLPDYILKFFVTTTSTNPLRLDPSAQSSEIKGLDYKELSFKCLEIKGDWVKVVCYADCEGCPQGETDIHGWLQWRKDGKIIIKQYYVC